MFRLSKTFSFEASHQLMHHDGKCARLHGHSWVMTVAVKGFDLQTTAKRSAISHPREIVNPKYNMLMDYADLKDIVQPIVANQLDHWHLNDTFDTDAPTSEYLAQMLFYSIRRALEAWQELHFGVKDSGISLEFVEINETCTSACRYSD